MTIEHGTVHKIAALLFIALWILAFLTSRAPAPDEMGPALENGIAFLHGLQNEDGSFPILQHNPARLKEDPEEKVSVMTTAQVMKHMAAVRTCGIDVERIDEMLSRGTSFLLDKSKDYRGARVWRFYANEPHPPPDSDDTAASVIALYLAGVPTSDLEGTYDTLARMQGPGGGFLTWIVPEGMLNTETVTVSARVATALSLGGISFDKGAFCTFIREKREVDHWSGAWIRPRPRYATYLAIESRRVSGCTSADGDAVVADYLRSTDMAMMDILDASHTILALVELDEPVPMDAMDTMLALQQDDGGFPDAAFFSQGPEDTSVMFSGRAFTAAFALSAMARTTCPTGSSTYVVMPQ